MKIKAKDIIDAIKESKHQWAGHVATLQNNTWTLRATSIYPENGQDQEGDQSEMDRRPCAPFGAHMAKTGPGQMPVEAIQGWVPP